ncbi:MAG: hypothetical protein FJ031_10695 [Chloroflexi bacterium]|nr:hypothetical protein [Chloroflexota bacterium]
MFRSNKAMPRIAAVLVIVALIASGCSALSASPTPSLQELQMTAQAVAAQTLAAQQIPTQPPPSPTIIPPTPLPVITASPEPVVEVAPPVQEVPQVVLPQVIVPEVPTQPVVIVQSSPTEESTELDCTGTLTPLTEGPRAPVQVVNKRGSAIILSYYLEPSPYGQCGSNSVQLDTQTEVQSLNLPLGCYWLYAWVTHSGKDESFQGHGCNTREGVTWNIYPDRIESVENTP